MKLQEGRTMINKSDTGLNYNHTLFNRRGGIET